MSAVGASGPWLRREIFTSLPTRRHLQSPRLRRRPRLRLGKEYTKGTFKVRKSREHITGQKPQGEQEI